MVEELAEELVVLDPDTADLHHLDAAATVVWRLLEGHTDLDSLVETVAAAVGTEVDRVGDDVAQLVEQLFGLGLLERVTGG